MVIMNSEKVVLGVLFLERVYAAPVALYPVITSARFVRHGLLEIARRLLCFHVIACPEPSRTKTVDCNIPTARCGSDLTHPSWTL